MNSISPQMAQIGAGNRIFTPYAPQLMAPERRAGRLRGKSDPIEALAVARAALREPRLSRPARTSSRFAI